MSTKSILHIQAIIKKSLCSFAAEKPALQFHLDGQISLVSRSKLELSFFVQCSADFLTFIGPTYCSLIPH